VYQPLNSRPTAPNTQSSPRWARRDSHGRSLNASTTTVTYRTRNSTSPIAAGSSGCTVPCSTASAGQTSGHVHTATQTGPATCWARFSETLIGTYPNHAGRESGTQRIAANRRYADAAMTAKATAQPTRIATPTELGARPAEARQPSSPYR